MPTPTGYTKNTPSGSPTSVTWSRACAVGNTLVLLAQHMGTNQITVTDNSAGTNVWTKVAASFDATTPATSERRVDLYMCVPTVAITSVTAASVGATATFWVLQAKDYAGALTVRNSAKWFGGAGPQAGVAAAAGDQLVTGCAYAATTGGTDQVTVAGWTLAGFNNISNVQSDLFELTAASTGTITPSFSISATIGVVTAALTASAPTAPTVDAQPDIYRTGAGSITLSATIRDAAAVTSAVFSLVSGPDAPTVTTTTNNLNTAVTTASATVAVIPGTYTFRMTGANAVPLQGTGDVKVYVAANTNGDVAVYSITSSTGYTNVGGAASILAALNDALATTYAETGAAPAAVVIQGVMCPFAAGQDIGFLLGGYSSPSTPSVTVQVTFYKEDGTTQIYQTSFTLPTVDTDTPVKFDATANAAVPLASDRRALRFKVSATQ
jgi:hypothetical protein